MENGMIHRIDPSGITIDFGHIKEYFKKEWDHKFIVPLDDIEFWQKVVSMKGCPVKDNLRAIDFTTVEWMVAEIQKDLLSLAMNELGLADDFSDGVPEVHFELSEGPNQGEQTCTRYGRRQ